MRVTPDCTYAEIERTEVVVIPGGSGARRETANRANVDWLRSEEPSCRWATSVCTGTFLLVGAGLAEGRQVMTHYHFLEALRDTGDAEVMEGVRFVRDGRIVSAGGAMSGIEMSIWPVEQIWDAVTADRVREYIDYLPRSNSVDNPGKGR